MGALFERFQNVQCNHFSELLLLQTGHGGVDEDRPAGLAKRHAVRLSDIQVL